MIVQKITPFDPALAAARKQRIICERRHVQTSAFKNDADRMRAALEYDLTKGSKKTGYEMLHEIGVRIPSCECSAVPALAISIVAEGLAQCGIFLVQTDHLSDSEMWERLQSLLREPTDEFDPSMASEIIGFVSDDDNARGLHQRKAYRDHTLPRPSWGRK